ncbi:MAG TPA: putative quinol monooxygenase [Solirubrobacteraceae bacterium]|nr:putative quinol monooxygenase [Solirubrobacteraceae bacterium]
MIVVHADVFAQIPQREGVREAMLLAQRAAREQDGCVSFQFAEALDEPGHFVAVERWRDGAALEAHFRSSSFQAYEEAVTPLLVRDSEVLVLTAQEELRPVDSSPLDLRQDD